MATDKLLEDVETKLTILTRLLAYQTVSKLTLSEGVPLLKRLGFSNSEIASIYDTTANTVAVRLVEAKKRLAKGK